jgi:hypothetical protein
MGNVFTFSIRTDDGEFINKILSIKGLRKLTGMGLKEAKELLELVQKNKSLVQSVDILELDEAEKADALRMIFEGGISVIDLDNAGTASKHLLDSIKSVAVKAVEEGQFDIARDLISILETKVI